MPPLTLTYRTVALRCLTLGGGALSGSEITPPHTGRKWLKIRDFVARDTGGRKARFLSRRGAGTRLLRVYSYIIINPKNNKQQ